LFFSKNTKGTLLPQLTLRKFTKKNVQDTMGGAPTPIWIFPGERLAGDEP